MSQRLLALRAHARALRWLRAAVRRTGTQSGCNADATFPVRMFDSPAAVRGSASAVVWGRPNSSNTQKVLWMCEELGVAYRLYGASARLGPASEWLCDKDSAWGVVDTPGFRKMSPFSQIPVLVDVSGVPDWEGLATSLASQAAVRDDNADGRTAGADLSSGIMESHTIVRYLAREYGPHMLGALPVQRAQAEGWMDWILHGYDHSPCFGSANHHLVDQVARTPPEQRCLELVSRAHNEYTHLFAKIEARLESQGTQFLVGDEMTVADVPLAAELNRWSLCLHALKRDGQEPGTIPAFPKLGAFYASLMARPAFVSAVYLPELQHQRLDMGAGLILAGLTTTGEEPC